MGYEIMTLAWTEEEWELFEKWVKVEPGLPIKKDCPEEIRKMLEEKLDLLDANKRKEKQI